MQKTEDSLDQGMDHLQFLQVKQGWQLSYILATKARTKKTRFMPSQNSIQPASQNQVIYHIRKPDMPDVLHNQETDKKSTSFEVNQYMDAAEKVDEGLNDDDRELSFPLEHITAAKKLLMWPSIKALLPEEYDEDYVMNLEDGRGLTFVYGQREGDDIHEGAQQGQQPSMRNTSFYPIPNWNQGFHPTGSPSDATWKAPGRKTPAAPETSVKKAEHGIEESGTFTADNGTVHRLHRSYMDHFHKLNPFLDPKSLEKKIEMFICMYCPTSGNHQQGAKRKRSEDKSLPSPVGVVRTDRSLQRRIEQSIDNAVILLVLALGSICEYPHCPVPAPVCRDYCKERDVNIIPGVAYYKYATQILGSLQGANSLPHVQAALLAGLYAGQLAHPLQSHGWINQAARACQVLVRPCVPRLFFGKQKLLTRL